MNLDLKNKRFFLYFLIFPTSFQIWCLFTVHIPILPVTDIIFWNLIFGRILCGYEFWISLVRVSFSYKSHFFGKKHWNSSFLQCWETFEERMCFLHLEDFHHSGLSATPHFTTLSCFWPRYFKSWRKCPRSDEKS